MDAYYHHLLYRADTINPNDYKGYDDKERKDLWNFKRSFCQKSFKFNYKTRPNKTKTK